MGTRDPRIDAYIAKSAEFARPILVHLREVVHAACPEVEETVKWSHPNFMYHGTMCGMNAFKAHCGFAFWKSDLIEAGDPKAHAILEKLGRVTKVSELPSKKVLTGYIRQAMKFNEEGVKAPWLIKRSKPKPPPVAPEDLLAALAKNKKARATFDAFSPSNRREYIDWITEAKREETRQKRLVETIEWLTEGKTRNWKYENC